MSDPKKITVFIYLPGETVAVPAGIFTHDGNLDVGGFAYGRRYLQRDNALPVDPVSLPLGVPLREVTSNRGLYGSFRDAAPDYWGRLVIAASRGVPPEALSEVDFLLSANATRVGNLDFRLSPESPEPPLSPPHFNQLEQLLEVVALTEAGNALAGHLLQLLDQGSSVGGARPKCTVFWRNAMWIAKFPSKNDTVNIPRIEFGTLTLAEKCGIRVPQLQLISIGGKDVLLVRRFDREAKGEQGWTRKGFLSALSLMNWDENDRFGWDYGTIADTMRRYTPVDDVQELFRRMVFNILVRNTDDHPRNHGFLYDRGNMTLSPAYDIVPSLSQPGVGTDFNLAMTVGVRGREASLENALSRSARFGLSADQANSIIDQLIETVRSWRDHFEAIGSPPQERESLAPSFSRCAVCRK